MIRTLGALQRLQRRGVFVLPFEPAHQPAAGRLSGRPGALDAERLAGIVAHRVGEPLAVALRRNETIGPVTERDLFHKPDNYNPNRAGLTRSSIGSIRLSTIASATSAAVSGASSTPLR